MVIINKNTTNNRVFSLYEKTTIQNPYYLFEFTNYLTKTAVYCIPTELSTELIRYNRFNITETSVTPDPLQGEVELSVGRYQLKVYEQASSTNLNPTGLNVVFDDDCLCEDSSTYVETVYNSTLTNTFYEQ